MNRYLLDTNILIFIILGNNEEISKDVRPILKDFSNQLYTSSIAVSELIHLHKINKIQSKDYKSALEIQEVIEKDFYIEILPFNKNHTKTLANLTIADGHNDPFDHAIISQAISDKLTLISSDTKFKHYTSQKLKFVFNRR
jgi:PIN domain nuclease of toxin-antitoxin system